jgi:hypothetical protein
LFNPLQNLLDIPLHSPPSNLHLIHPNCHPVFQPLNQVETQLVSK